MALPPLAVMSAVEIAQLQPPLVPGPEDWAASEAWLKKAIDIAQRDAADLFSYFRAGRKNDLTCDIVREKDDLLARIFPGLKRLSSAASPPSGDRSDAEIAITDQDLAFQATYLYYFVLHYVLRKLFPRRLENTAARFSKPTVAPEDVHRVIGLLRIPAFHSSLLVVASMLVRAINSRDPNCLGRTPDVFLRTAHNCGFAGNGLALWNASRWFEEAFTTAVAPATDGNGPVGAGAAAAPGPPLPSIPGRQVLGRLQRLCEEREVLADNSTFYPIYASLGRHVEWSQDYSGVPYTEGDARLVLTFLEAYNKRAVNVAYGVASKLVLQLKASQQPQTSPRSLVPLEEFPSMAFDLVDTLLATIPDITWNQHMSVFLACCIYGLAKAARLTLSFDAVMAVFLTEMPDHSAQIFEKQVELSPAVPGLPPSPRKHVGAEEEDCGYTIARPAELGSIRQFYNTIFLHRAEGEVRQVVAARTNRLNGPTTTSKAVPPPAPRPAVRNSAPPQLTAADNFPFAPEAAAAGPSVHRAGPGAVEGNTAAQAGGAAGGGVAPYAPAATRSLPTSPRAAARKSDPVTAVTTAHGQLVVTPPAVAARAASTPPAVPRTAGCNPTRSAGDSDTVSEFSFGRPPRGAAPQEHSTSLGEWVPEEPPRAVPGGRPSATAAAGGTDGRGDRRRSVAPPQAATKFRRLKVLNDGDDDDDNDDESSMTSGVTAASEGAQPAASRRPSAQIALRDRKALVNNAAAAATASDAPASALPTKGEQEDKAKSEPGNLGWGPKWKQNPVQRLDMLVEAATLAEGSPASKENRSAGALRGVEVDAKAGSTKRQQGGRQRFW